VFSISETTPFDAPLKSSATFRSAEILDIEFAIVTPDLSLLIYATRKTLGCIDAAGKSRFKHRLLHGWFNNAVALSPDGTVLYQYEWGDDDDQDDLITFDVRDGKVLARKGLGYTTPVTPAHFPGQNGTDMIVHCGFFGSNLRTSVTLKDGKLLLASQETHGRGIPTATSPDFSTCLAYTLTEDGPRVDVVSEPDGKLIRSICGGDLKTLVAAPVISDAQYLDNDTAMLLANSTTNFRSCLLRANLRAAGDIRLVYALDLSSDAHFPGDGSWLFKENENQLYRRNGAA
jgi:hypothetical protein